MPRPELAPPIRPHHTSETVFPTEYFENLPNAAPMTITTTTTSPMPSDRKHAFAIAVHAYYSLLEVWWGSRLETAWGCFTQMVCSRIWKNTRCAASVSFGLVGSQPRLVVRSNLQVPNRGFSESPQQAGCTCSYVPALGKARREGASLFSAGHARRCKVLLDWAARGPNRERQLEVNRSFVEKPQWRVVGGGYGQATLAVYCDTCGLDSVCVRITARN